MSTTKITAKVKKEVITKWYAVLPSGKQVELRSTNEDHKLHGIELIGELHRTETQDRYENGEYARSVTIREWFEPDEIKYGDYVQLDDRFETVHIWSKEIEQKNNGRWKPLKITKEKYDQEMKEFWNLK